MIDLFPKVKFKNTFFYECDIPVRQLDINFGGHLSSHTILDYIVEAHAQFLNKHNFTFKNVYGYGQLFKTVSIKYCKEVFYPDLITIKISVQEFKRNSIIFYNELYNSDGEICQKCFLECVYMDLALKKIILLPKEIIDLLKNR